MGFTDRRFTVNLSILFTELPLLERPAAAGPVRAGTASGEVVSSMAPCGDTSGDTSVSSALPRVAWIGLGVMGSPMSENLIRAGYDVTGHTLEQHKLGRLTAADGTAAGPVCAPRRLRRLGVHSEPADKRALLEEHGSAARTQSPRGRTMSESMPLRCPACRREHVYTAPAYPCACGTPVRPPLDRAAPPTTLAHRTWDDDWVTLRCPSCGGLTPWPHPELGCPCGTVLRVPVLLPGAVPTPLPALPLRPDHTTRDAVTAVTRYLRGLGHENLRQTGERPPAGVSLAAQGLRVQVDPGPRPASLRDVECLWLAAMTESADCVYFSTAGYAEDARSRADSLGIPLFRLDPLDLMGTPHPVNDPADELHATARREPP
jgi:NAD binding domain of 6-phosphogluconate dehydrogenase